MVTVGGAARRWEAGPDRVAPRGTPLAPAVGLGPARTGPGPGPGRSGAFRAPAGYTRRTPRGDAETRVAARGPGPTAGCRLAPCRRAGRPSGEGFRPASGRRRAGPAPGRRPAARAGFECCVSPAQQAGLRSSKRSPAGRSAGPGPGVPLSPHATHGVASRCGARPAVTQTRTGGAAADRLTSDSRAESAAESARPGGSPTAAAAAAAAESPATVRRPPT